MSEKYDIIYDDSACGWVHEKAYEVVNLLMSFLKEYKEKYMKIPNVLGLTLGLDVWQWVTNHPLYNSTTKTISLYGIELPIIADWTCNSNYIELVLK